MTPEYLEELAAHVDPEQLWRLSLFDQMELPAEKRRQLDAAVALRRHASHIRQLRELLGQQRSLLITPLSPNSAAIKSVPTPGGHKRLQAQQQLTRSQRLTEDGFTRRPTGKTAGGLMREDD